jgi:Tol biopolymer transport system component
LLAAALLSGCGSEPSKKPAAAADGAGLVFTRQSGQISGVWVAAADGSSPRQIVANGSDGTLSPNGRQMTYNIPKGGDHWLTNIKNVAIGDPRPLGEVTVLDWSPDSKRLLVSDSKRLLLVEAASGASRELASGFIGGASFSPDGTAVVFSRTNDPQALKWRSDIFVIRLSDDSVVRLTEDGQSEQPLWRAEWIAFRRTQHDADRPVAGLYLMHPDGKEVRQLATERTEPLSLGLLPLDFSKDGTKLLSCAATGEFCWPVTFDVPDGTAHHLSAETEDGPVAQDLSEDGTQVLVAGRDGQPGGLYVTPFAGGNPRLLVENVVSGSWAG